MTQGDSNGNKTSTETAARSIKHELLDWLANNLFYAILPLFVSYLALSVTRNPVSVLDRGDMFIIIAALLAPEIAALHNLKPTEVTYNVKSLLSVMTLFVVLSTLLFVASISDYNETHPDITVSKGNAGISAVVNNVKRAEASSPPFPILTADVISTVSILMFLVTIVLIYYSIRERDHIGGVS